MSSSVQAIRQAEWHFKVALAACLVGLAVAAKLTALHIEVHHDPGLQLMHPLILYAPQVART